METKVHYMSPKCFPLLFFQKGKIEEELTGDHPRRPVRIGTEVGRFY